MSLLFSTGTRQGMANATGLRTQFAKGALYLYSGVQPLDADQAVGSSTPLGIVTASAITFVPGGAANGLNFDVPVLGVLSKAAAETWQAVCSAVGTLGWFRLVGNPVDSFAASTTLSRIDGSIATSGGDLNIPNLVVAINTPITIDVFALTLPA